MCSPLYILSSAHYITCNTSAMQAGIYSLQLLLHDVMQQCVQHEERVQHEEERKHVNLDF